MLVDICHSGAQGMGCTFEPCSSVHATAPAMRKLVQKQGLFLWVSVMIISLAGFFEPTTPKKAAKKGAKAQSGPEQRQQNGTVISPAYAAALDSDVVTSFALANKEGNEVAEADQVWPTSPFAGGALPPGLLDDGAILC